MKKGETKLGKGELWQNNHQKNLVLVFKEPKGM